MANVALGVTPAAGLFEIDVVSVASNVFTTLGNHGFAAGDRVHISGYPDKILAITTVSGSTPSKSVDAYVTATSLTDNTFTVSATNGGAVRPFTNSSALKGRVRPIGVVMSQQVTLNQLLSASEASTTVNLNNGHGDNLPAAPFVLVVGGPSPTYPTATYERLLVTDKTGDVLTVVRGYEGTTVAEHAAGRLAWVRSLAPSALPMAHIDWREYTVRNELAPGTLKLGVDPSSNDACDGSGTGQWRTRDNSLFAAIVTGDTMTVTGSHGMVVGDRFAFLTKTGGSNLRLGLTYYVTDTVDGLQFAEEKHLVAEPSTYAYTTKVTAATAVTAATIRVFTRSDVPVFLHDTSLYPKTFGYFMTWSNGDLWSPISFNGNPWTTQFMLDPLVLRGVVPLVNMMSVTDDTEPADSKRVSQMITFPASVSGGSWTITINGTTTRAYNYSTDPATMRYRLRQAIISIVGNEDRVTCMARPTYNKNTGALVSRVYQVTFMNSLRGITALNGTNLIGNSLENKGVSIGDKNMLVLHSVYSTVADRLQKFGEQIAAMRNTQQNIKGRVIIRFNYEFDNKNFYWGAFPEQTGLAGAHMVWSAGHTAATWRQQWVNLVNTIQVDAGATNAKFLWNPMTCVTPWRFRDAYPSAAPPDYVGFDIYTHVYESPTSLRSRLASHFAGMGQVVAKPTYFLGEFGHHVGGYTMHNPTYQASTMSDPVTGLDTITGDDFLNAGAVPDNTVNIYQTVTTAASDTRDDWFNAFLVYLYNRADVAGISYFDIYMPLRTSRKASADNWVIDASPSLVPAWTARTLDKRNRRRL